MENLKKVLIFALGIVMALGVTPAFATGPTTGTNGVTVGVTPSVSLLVTGNAAFPSLAADNILQTAQPININSTSNVAIDVGVQALNWTSTNGNMPLSALVFGTSNTQMTNNEQNAITNLAAGNTFNSNGNGTGNAQDVNLNMQVPFGTLANNYSTTVTWTAAAHGA
jgi:hypothetical protein